MRPLIERVRKAKLFDNHPDKHPDESVSSPGNSPVSGKDDRISDLVSYFNTYKQLCPEPAPLMPLGDREEEEEPPDDAATTLHAATTLQEKAEFLFTRFRVAWREEGRNNVEKFKESWDLFQVLRESPNFLQVVDLEALKEEYQRFYEYLQSEEGEPVREQLSTMYQITVNGSPDLPDLPVRSDSGSGSIPQPPPAPPPPTASSPNPPSTPSWTVVAVSVSLGFVFLGSIGVLCVYYYRGVTGAKKKKKVNTTDPSIDGL